MIIIVSGALVLNLYLSIFVNRLDPRDWIVTVLIWTAGSSATHLMVGAIGGLLWSFLISFRKRKERKKTLRRHAKDVCKEGCEWFQRELLTE